MGQVGRRNTVAVEVGIIDQTYKMYSAKLSVCLKFNCVLVCF